MPKRRTNKPNEDTVLWQRVIKQVTPLKSTNEAAEFPIVPVYNSPLQKKSSSVPYRILKKMATVGNLSGVAVTVTETATSRQIKPIDLRRGDKAGIDGRTKRRLSRGEVPVDRRLDLHGMTAARAQSHLIHFIELSAYEGCRCVLVITGKGSGVLHGHVPEWLKRFPLSSHVLALAEARPKDGGSGALYVLLRRKRDGH